MPRPHEHRAIHVLLPLWMALLTFGQVGLVIIYFTAEHHSQPENLSSGEAYPTEQTSTNVPERSKMLNFVTNKGNVSTIKWITSEKHPWPILVVEDHLVIKKDGYYFLCLQVTLKTQLERVITVKILNPSSSKYLLKAQINKNAISTGTLGKAEKLSAGTKLLVTINPPAFIDEATYLDVVFIETGAPV